MENESETFIMNTWEIWPSKEGNRQRDWGEWIGRLSLQTTEDTEDTKDTHCQKRKELDQEHRWIQLAKDERVLIILLGKTWRSGYSTTFLVRK